MSTFWNFLKVWKTSFYHLKQIVFYSLILFDVVIRMLLRGL